MKAISRKKATTDEKRNACRAWIKQFAFWNKPFFAKTYFPHLVSDKYAEYQKEILRAIAPDTRGKLYAVAAPRGGGKTSLHIISIVHNVVYKSFFEALDLVPNDFIVVVGESDGGYDVVDNVRHELESNPFLAAHFGNLKGERFWSRKRTLTRNDCLILPKSRNERVRGLNYKGKRPRLTLITDIQKPMHVQSPTQRAKDKNWLTQDIARLGDNKGTMNLLVEGTILHQDALLASLLNNPSYDSHTYKAIMKWSSREDLWNEWKARYVDLTDPNRLQTARAFFEANRNEMMGGVEVSWPEGLSYYRCMEIIVRDGKYAFMKEMQQEPDDPERQQFNMEDAVRFSVEREGLMRDDRRLVKWEDITGVSIFLDWSSGKAAVDNCYAAIATIAWERFPHTKEAYAYCLDVWLSRVPPSKQIERFFDYFDKYSLFTTKMGSEDPIMTESLIDDFRAEMEKRSSEGRAVPSLPSLVSRSVNKVDRISRLEPKIANGWLAFNTALPHEFIEQMRQFPTHMFLDGPDALEGAYSLKISQKAIKEKREYPPVKVRL